MKGFSKLEQTLLWISAVIMLGAFLLYGNYRLSTNSSKSDYRSIGTQPTNKENTPTTQQPIQQKPTVQQTTPKSTDSSTSKLPNLPTIHVDPPPDIKVQPAPTPQWYTVPTPTSSSCKPIIMQGQNSGLYSCPKF